MPNQDIGNLFLSRKINQRIFIGENLIIEVNRIFFSKKKAKLIITNNEKNPSCVKIKTLEMGEQIEIGGITISIKFDKRINCIMMKCMGKKSIRILREEVKERETIHSDEEIQLKQNA